MKDIISKINEAYLNNRMLILAGYKPEYLFINNHNYDLLKKYLVDNYNVNSILILNEYRGMKVCKAERLDDNEIIIT